MMRTYTNDLRVVHGVIRAPGLIDTQERAPQRVPTRTIGIPCTNACVGSTDARRSPSWEALATVLTPMSTETPPAYTLIFFLPHSSSSR